MNIVLKKPDYSGFKDIPLYKNYFLASAVPTKKRIVSINENNFRCFEPKIVFCTVKIPKLVQKDK